MIIESGRRWMAIKSGLIAAMILGGIGMIVAGKLRK